jgi:adenylylsulfate kinase
VAYLIKVMAEKLHIVEHSFGITRHERETANGHKSGCLWFTGLSGSGKSTLANVVEQELFSRGVKTFVLDGDNVRNGLNKGLTFTPHDRDENLRRIGEVSKLMCDAGLVVLAAFVSPFIRERQMVRDLLGESFTEIFVDTPIEICEQRDVKGLYKKARAGEISNFTGISSPFEAPPAPDIHVKTNEQTLEQAANLVLENVLPKIQLSN